VGKRTRHMLDTCPHCKRKFYSPRDCTRHMHSGCNSDPAHADKNKCRHCGGVFSNGKCAPHERACIHNPNVKATVRMLMQDAPGIACGSREYIRRRPGIVGAPAAITIMDQLGSNRWADVAEHFGLVFIPEPGARGDSTATQEWKNLNKTTPAPSGGGWLEATDYGGWLTCRHKDVRERVYLMPNGYGLRIVTDVYEVR